MKNLSLTTFLVTLSVPALAEMPRVEPILSVAPVSGPSTEVRICAGAPGGAYHSIASQMLGLVQSGALRPLVRHSVPLDGARQALEAVSARATTGKVILVP